jgi:hypothetical protein
MKNQTRILFGRVGRVAPRAPLSAEKIPSIHIGQRVRRASEPRLRFGVRAACRRFGFGARNRKSFTHFEQPSYLKISTFVSPPAARAERRALPITFHEN